MNSDRGYILDIMLKQLPPYKVAERCVEMGDEMMELLLLSAVGGKAGPSLADYMKLLGGLTDAEKVLDWGWGLLMNEKKSTVDHRSERKGEETAAYELLTNLTNKPTRTWVGSVLCRCSDETIQKLWSKLENDTGCLREIDSETIHGFLDAKLDLQKANEFGNKPLRSYFQMLTKKDRARGSSEVEEERGVILRMAQMGNGLADLDWVPVKPEVEFIKAGHDIVFKLLRDEETLREETGDGRLRQRRKI